PCPSFISGNISGGIMDSEAVTTASPPRSMGSGGSHGRRFRMPKGVAPAALLAFAGIAMMLYPSMAAWFSQYQQSKLLVSIEQTIAQGPSTVIDEEIVRA